MDQLNRVALSISANIAEGNGRFTKDDRKNFLIIAHGSFQEFVLLLELARRRSLLDEAKHAELKSQLEEISKMLLGPISGLENRKIRRLIMHASPKKFSWCPVTPTLFRIEPFGEYVEGLSHLYAKSYVV